MAQQTVSTTFEFAMRGEQQVERNLSTLIQQIGSARSGADIAAVALEKFARVFRVGLPVGLAASGIGIATEKIYDMGKAALDLRDKLAQIGMMRIDPTVSTDKIREKVKEFDPIIQETKSASSHTIVQTLKAGAKEAFDQFINIGNETILPFMTGGKMGGATPANSAAGAVNSEAMDEKIKLQNELIKRAHLKDFENLAELRGITDDKILRDNQDAMSLTSIGAKSAESSKYNAAVTEASRNINPTTRRLGILGADLQHEKGVQGLLGSDIKNVDSKILHPDWDENTPERAQELAKLNEELEQSKKKEVDIQNEINETEQDRLRAITRGFHVTALQALGGGGKRALHLGPAGFGSSHNIGEKLDQTNNHLDKIRKMPAFAG